MPLIKKFGIPHISEFKSRKEWEKAAWRLLVKRLASIRLPEKLGGHLSILLSPEERRRMLWRASAINLIESGKGYQEISKELWLSPQTISVIKKALRDQTYRSYHDRGKTERKKRVYGPEPSVQSTRRSGRRIRTKYGTLRMPY